MLGSIDVRRPQVADQLVTAEHIQRQETVVVIVAMEEVALLVAVGGVVGGVEVEDQRLIGRGRKRRDELIDEHPSDLHQRRAAHPILKPTQRRWRCQGYSGIHGSIRSGRK